MAKPRKAPARVFLNIPYDAKFERLFLAYISAISAFGLVPRATLEITTGTRRLDRILDLVRDSRYSIHDLSRVQLDRHAPSTPRFNMPFELGLTVAMEKTKEKTKHQWFVCESERFRLAKSLSDLNGTDPLIHDGTIAGVFREVCNMFRRTGRQPSIKQMEAIYRELRKSLPAILLEAGAANPFTARVFKDLSVVASAAADEIV